jgi:exodeoxyribonuclease VII large subunit
MAVSPRGVLARGYALVRLADGRLVRSWRESPPGTRLAIEFADGGARATVDSAEPPSTGGSHGR